MRRLDLIELLSRVRSRGEIKKLGERVDREAPLRDALLLLAKERRIPIDANWSGKKLVRAIRDREGESRIRSNPIHRDEAFRCRNCGAEVGRGGARVRDHCPRCLRGLHVDRTPGDRAADCGGILDPMALSLEGRAGVVIDYRCRRCGYEWRGRAHPDDAVPASLSVSDLPGSGDDSHGEDKVDARARTLPLRVLEQIKKQNLWLPGQRVRVAVSGGLDSSVLMEVLFELRSGHGAELDVASVDHGLRPESVAEVAQVGRRARELGLPFAGLRLQLEPGANLQSRARDARREALRDSGIDRVALGHHRDDQAETVFHHLLRGSGARGLRGMRISDPPWVRPLLDEPRAVLAAWARSRGLRWVEDPSNPSSQRGRIREIMPLLDEFRGGAAAALSRSARLLAREDDFLNTVTEELWGRLNGPAGLEWQGLRAVHPALRLRLLLRLVAECPHPIRADALESAAFWTPRGGARIELGGGYFLLYRDGVIGIRGPE